MGEGLEGAEVGLGEGIHGEGMRHRRQQAQGLGRCTLLAKQESRCR